MKSFYNFFWVQIKEFNLKQIFLVIFLAFFSILASPVFMQSRQPLSSLFLGSISGPELKEIRLIAIFQIILLWTVVTVGIMKKFAFYEQMKELIILRFKSIYAWTVVEAISFMIYEILFLFLYLLSILFLNLLLCQGDLDLLPTGIIALKTFSIYFLGSLLLVIMIFIALLLFHSTQQTTAIIFLIFCLNAFSFQIFRKFHYLLPGQIFYIGRIFKLSFEQLKLLITVTSGEIGLLLVFFWQILKKHDLYLIEG
ncbi:MAG: hypothetical protein LBF32_03375 [Streptococcaceae bacterium]|jgi:hypothetical protein|nr:hypothetical protein [Streptococcaceae bacterium]